MNLITKKELKKKIDNKDDFKLVLALSAWQFDAKRIPGSINVHSPTLAKKLLKRKDEIVVYCTNPLCPASRKAYYKFTNLGYKNIRRYAGGLEDWEEAGYPLEGDMVKQILNPQLELNP